MAMPDPYGPQLRQLSRYMTDVNRDLNRSFKPLIETIQRNLKLSLSPDLLAQMQRTADAVRQAFLRSAPPNWAELSFGVWRDAIALGTEHGINVLWAPRSEIICQLVAAANEPSRFQVLLTREGDILDDIDEVLNEATHEDFGHLPSLARKAVAAQRAGHPEAGQALASAVITGVVEDTLGFDRLGEARRRFHETDPIEGSMDSLPLRTILHTLGRALHRMDEAPPGFNRNSSLHCHPTQFTRVNATTSMLIMAGVFGELQRLRTLRDAEDGCDAEAA